MSSILKSYQDDLFFRVKIRIRFRDRILAGIPRAQAMLDYFMKARHMSDAEKEAFQRRVKEGSLTEEDKAQIKDVAWCKFEPDYDGNLCLYHGNVKAMLREMFTTFGLTQRQPNKRDPKKQGGDPNRDQSAGGRQTFQHAVNVEPIYIPFERSLTNGSTEKIKCNDGYEEIPDNDGGIGEGAIRKLAVFYGYVDRVKHIEDAAGRRSALGRHDYLYQPELTFELEWPARGCFSEDDMKMAVAAAEKDGLGACRSQGFGKFETIAWEVVNEPKKREKKPEEESEETDDTEGESGEKAKKSKKGKE